MPIREASAAPTIAHLQGQGVAGLRVACRTGYRYKFPGGHLKRGLYCGQVQTYFLCAYDGDGTDIDLTRHQREFSGTKWIRPEKFRLKWVPKFKRRVFRAVMKDFFGVKPKS